MSQLPPPRLALSQFLTVPIFAAVAMACIAPAARGGVVRSYGLFQILLVEAIAVPLAMALVALVVLRRGGSRDRFVAGLMGLSASAAILSLMALGAVTIWDIGASVANDREVPVDLVAFVIATAGGLIALNAAMSTLLPRIFPARCPNCGVRAVVPDRAQSDRDRRRPVQGLSCDACGEAIDRERSGEARSGRDPLIDRGPGRRASHS